MKPYVPWAIASVVLISTGHLIGGVVCLVVATIEALA